MEIKNVVLSTVGEYSLIARVKEDNTVFEHVVAWCYDTTTGEWAHGNYFAELKDALICLMTKGMTPQQKREVLIEEMHEYIRTSVDDEYAYMTWINYVPDEPQDFDFEFIAETYKEWHTCVDLFSRVVKEYEK